MIEANQLRELLANEASPRVVIIGDLIVDRYISGDVSRISPEAPIPVLAARSSELRLGGAGNVAANLRAMEAEVAMVGVVGDDSHGALLRELFEADGIGTGGVILDSSRPTIEKTRMMSGVQQMLRVDWEDTRPIDSVVLARMLEVIPRELEGADAVVLSDYGKGTLAQGVIDLAISEARARSIPVLVDPKGADFSRYAGATLVTPNRKEAEHALGRELSGLSDLPGAADELIAAASLAQVVITLGGDGIYFRARDGALDGRIPTQARAVFDVTGAGDTVVAHLAFHLGAGLELEAAVTLANHAAGIVVAKLGTHAVTRSELFERLLEGQPLGTKVASAGSLSARLDGWRREGKRVVFTNGCFDVLHAGHVSYLRFARTRGDVLVVGVNDDPSVARLKGPERPVNSLEDRLAVLSALEVVDAVIAFGEDTPKALVELVSPDVLVKGEDYADQPVVGREWVESHGGQVVLAPLLEGRSTTGILDRTGSAPGLEGSPEGSPNGSLNRGHGGGAGQDA